MNKVNNKSIMQTALVLLFLVQSFLVNAADIFVSTPAFNPDPGQQFEIEISVDVDSDVLGNYFFNLNYDAAVLNIISINGGDSTEFSLAPFTDVSTFNAGQTPITFAQGNMSSPTGMVSVAKVLFQAVGLAGEVSPVEVDVIALGGANMMPLAANIFSTSVQLSFNAADDTDGDGLTDVAEANAGTDINLDDTDGDGLNDSFEVLNGLNALDNGSTDPLQGINGDPDNDTLTNAQEQTLGTNPTQADSDFDGLRDDAEVALGTNPLSDDSDGDLLLDAFEVNGLLDALDDGSTNPENGATADPDADGLTNLQEQEAGTLPREADTDGDGLSDGYELNNGLDPLDNGSIDINQSPNADPDSDSLTNLDEFLAGTNPLNADTDGDQLPDNYELSNSLDPLDDGSTNLVNGALGDPDNDGFSNFDEFEVSSNPQDNYSRPINISIELQPGQQLIFQPFAQLSGLTSFELFSELNSDIQALRMFAIENGQDMLTVQPFGFELLGDDFLVEKNQGFIADVDVANNFEHKGPINCGSINLSVGVNLIGFECLPQNYSASELLVDLGSESSVASIQRFNANTGRYETTVINGSLQGEDFPIKVGEAYLIHMKVALTGFDPLQ